MLRSAPWSRGICPSFVLGAFAIMAWGCAPVTFEALAERCVGGRLDEPACAEAKLAVIAQQRAPGDPGNLVCKDGFQDGESCSTNADCRREAVCWQGPNHGESCTTNFDCNLDPRQGSDLCFHAPTQVCDSNADCPGVCEGSGESCNGDGDCNDPVCDGGFNDGIPCDNNNACPGTCVDSNMAGNLCLSDQPCTECLCSGSADVEEGTLQFAWSCTVDGFIHTCFDQCSSSGGAGVSGQPCATHNQCPSGICVTNTSPTFVGSCSDIGTCDPGEVRCEERFCLNDWVICIGRGFCVPDGALGFTPRYSRGEMGTGTN